MSYIKKVTDSVQHKGIKRHFLFWIGIILLTIPQNVLESEQPFINTLVYKICVLIPQILFTYFVTYFVIQKFLSKKKYTISLFLMVFSTYFFSVLARVLTIHVGENLVRTPPFEQETLLEIITQLNFLFLHYVPVLYSIIFIFLAVKYFTNFKIVQEKELRSRTEKIASELKTLKAQLNPHFLFNTLNNIYVLSLENSPKTPKSIEKLSKILDHVLYCCNTKYVSLSSEIELLENYIELEKLRYNDRLEINFNDHIEQDGEIAPLILLSLVENAFKHGAGEDSGSPNIDIFIYNSEKEFKFVISNTVSKTDEKEEKDAIGLINIRKQLDLIYENVYSLEIEQRKHLFTVTLIINN